MLEMDADNRINADQALSHPYLAQYADPSDEPVSLPYDQTFEDFDLPVEKWKGLYLTMVFCYQNCSDLPQCRKTVMTPLRNIQGTRTMKIYGQITVGCTCHVGLLAKSFENIYF